MIGVALLAPGNGGRLSGDRGTATPHPGEQANRDWEHGLRTCAGCEAKRTRMRIASGDSNRRVQGGSVQTLHGGTGIRLGAKAPGGSFAW